MKTDTTEPSSKSFIKSVFSPGLVTWLLTLSFGILFPLFSEQFIALQLSTLSLLPQIGEVTLASAAAQQVAMVTLFMLFASYVIVLTIQLWILVKNQKVTNLIPLPVTIMAPIFCWLLLPYFL